MVDACIGRQFVRIAKQKYIHCPVARRQQSCDDKAIASVVSRTAKHQGTMGRLGQFGPARKNRVADPLPGALHELQSCRFTGLHLGQFQRAHLGRRQQFCHCVTPRDSVSPNFSAQRLIILHILANYGRILFAFPVFAWTLGTQDDLTFLETGEGGPHEKDRSSY